MEKSKVVVVTGASGGVGRAAARRFAQDGHAVGLIARGAEGLAGAAADVRERGGTAHQVQADVADFEQLRRAAAEIEEALGPIDIWVNNAMVTIYGEFVEIEPEEFRRATEVTYLGAVWGTKVALDLMLARGRGTIVQVSSALAYRGIPLQSAYCGSKHAIKGFTESVRTELLHRNSPVRVSMVALPGLNTTQFGWGRTKLRRQPQPVPPIYQPEVAADAIHYCAFHDRREIWVGAPTVWTILGERLAPWLGDRYLAKTGFASQQTAEPVRPDRHDNLFEPVDAGADRGAHGTFDAKAHGRSPQLWLAKHHRAVAAAGAAGVTAVAALARRA